MKIQNSIKTYYYTRQSQVTQSTAQRDFLGIMNSVTDAKTDEQAKETASCLSSSDPSLAYEQLKASAPLSNMSAVLTDSLNTNPPNYQSSTYVGGIYFDDAEFAWCIQRHEGTAVNTDNPINWASTGEHQLTEAEIADLKSKYDVTDLTPQKYYDLMADLCQLNAISSEEVVSKYSWKMADPDFRLDDAGVLVMKCPTQGNPTFCDDFRRRSITNLLNNLEEGMDTYTKYTSYVSKTEFQNLNHVLFNEKPELFKQFQIGYQEGREKIARFYSVIEQLH